MDAGGGRTVNDHDSLCCCVECLGGSLPEPVDEFDPLWVDQGGEGGA